MKTSLYTAYIRYFYSVHGDLDEYRLREIEHFGSNMFLLTYSLLIIALLAIMARWEDVASLAFFIALFLPDILRDRLVKRLGLNTLEVLKEDLPKARRKMLHKSLFQTGQVLLLILFFLYCIWVSGVINDPIISFDFYLGIIVPITTALHALVAFIIFFFHNRKKIILLEH